MLLHLFNDEKIMNRTIQNFEEALPNQNIFVCIMKGDNPKYVSKELGVIFTDLSSPLKEDLGCVTTVIIHLLFEDKIVFLEQNRLLDRRIFWIEWGMDLYNSLLFHAGFPMFYNYYKEYGRKNVVKSFIKYQILKYREPEDTRIINFVNKYVTDVNMMSEEVDLWKKYINKNASFVNHEEFFYYPIDEILGTALIDKEANGNYILVGNSASNTNNHKYVFEYLQKMDLKEKQIVCPLSYGGWSQGQRNELKDYAKSLFGDRFVPLMDFLPLDQYNMIMSQAEVCIYGSWRQEAFGNILIGLYLGAKVFMSNKSPLFKEIKRLGLIVFEIEKDLTSESLHMPLSSIEKKHNRDLLINIYNKANQIKAIKKIWGDLKN